MTNFFVRLDNNLNVKTTLTSAKSMDTSTNEFVEFSAVEAKKGSAFAPLVNGSKARID